MSWTFSGLKTRIPWTSNVCAPLYSTAPAVTRPDARARNFSMPLMISTITMPLMISTITMFSYKLPRSGSRLACFGVWIPSKKLTRPRSLDRDAKLTSCPTLPARRIGCRSGNAYPIAWLYLRCPGCKKARRAASVLHPGCSHAPSGQEGLGDIRNLCKTQV